MIAQTSLTLRAWIELTLLGIFWGASFFSIAIALREIGFFTVVAHRVFWAALILWGVVWWRKLTVPRDLRIWGAFLVMGALNNAIPFSLMSWAQQHIETGLTSILNAMTAPFGILVAAAFLADERLSSRKLLGAALGVFGVVLAIGPEALAGLDLRSISQIAVLGGALSYAFAGVWARLRLRGLAPEVAAAGMLTGSSLIMVPTAIWMEGMPRFDLALPTWTAIAYYAGLGTAGAYLLYYRVLEVAGAGNLMLVTLMIPPIAITLGAIWLNESLTPLAFAGFALIALGLVVIDGRLAARVRRVLSGRAETS